MVEFCAMSFVCAVTVSNATRLQPQNLGEDQSSRKAPDVQSGHIVLGDGNWGSSGVDVLRTYSATGFSQFKTEGRGLGSALIPEFCCII